MQYGYNIFKGNPLSKHDEGFSGRVFTFDWNRISRGRDGRLYPKDIGIIPNKKCSSKVKTKVFNNKKEEQDEIKLSVGIDNDFRLDKDERE